MSSAQPFNHNVFTAVAFDTSAYDDNNYHSVTTNNTRMTPGFVGKVRLRAGASIGNFGGANQVALRFTEQGSTLTPNNEVLHRGSGEFNFVTITSPVLDTTAGSYFEVELFQNTGSTATLRADFAWYEMEVIERA